MSHLACTSCGRVSEHVHEGEDSFNAPIHGQFLLVACLYWASFWEALYYLHRTVKLGINKFTGVHRGKRLDCNQPANLGNLFVPGVKMLARQRKKEMRDAYVGFSNMLHSVLRNDILLITRAH